jgi:hypothetical protein
MTQQQIGELLGISQSVVAKLIKRGMPTNSIDAAQAWRESNAPPRAKRGQAGTPPPAPKRPKPDPKVRAEPLPEPPPEESATSTPPDEKNNDPRQSLRRARIAEMAGYNQLVQVQKNGGSIEDFRKANSVYIHSRNNRIKAEKDFRDWQRDQGILLYFDEAREIASRPHVAARGMIEIMPKNLSPRLFNQPQKAIEKTLAEWCDRLTETIRSKI